MGLYVSSKTFVASEHQLTKETLCRRWSMIKRKTAYNEQIPNGSDELKGKLTEL